MYGIRWSGFGIVCLALAIVFAVVGRARNYDNPLWFNTCLVLLGVSTIDGVVWTVVDHVASRRHHETLDEYDASHGRPEGLQTTLTTPIDHMKREPRGRV